MKKTFIYLALVVFSISTMAQDVLQTNEKDIQTIKKELEYLRQRNSDLKVQLQKTKNELAAFRELQMDNIENIDNRMLQLTSSNESNREFIDVLKKDQEKTDKEFESRISFNEKKISQVLLFMLMVLFVTVLLPLVLFMQRRKRIKSLTASIDVKLLNTKEDLLMEINKLSKLLNEKIDSLVNNNKKKK